MPTMTTIAECRFQGLAYTTWCVGIKPQSKSNETPRCRSVMLHAHVHGGVCLRSIPCPRHRDAATLAAGGLLRMYGTQDLHDSILVIPHAHMYWWRVVRAWMWVLLGFRPALSCRALRWRGCVTRWDGLLWLCFVVAASSGVRFSCRILNTTNFATIEMVGP